MTHYENRPSAGIGVIEVQKLVVFWGFVLARGTLCGDRRGRGAKTRVFAILFWLARPSAGIGVVGAKTRVFAILFWLARPSGIGVVEVQKLVFFVRFCFGSRDSLGSAWSRCKNTSFFLRFVLARATLSRCKNSRFFTISAVLARLCGDRRGRGAKTRRFGVVRTGHRELSRGSRACSGDRRVAGSIPRAGFASCTEQLA